MPRPLLLPAGAVERTPGERPSDDMGMGAVPRTGGAPPPGGATGQAGVQSAGGI